MEETQRRIIIRKAEDLWNANHPLEVGRLLFERIPREARPAWAAEILEVARGRIPPIPEVEAVIVFARSPETWGNGSDSKSREAHNFFGAVRQYALKHKSKDTLLQNVLSLAENVAKVTYNAYGYGAPFDHNAGWRIAANLKNIIMTSSDAEFAERAWATFAQGQYIQADEPVRCNPFCSTCMSGKLTFEIE